MLPPQQSYKGSVVYPYISKLLLGYNVNCSVLRALDISSNKICRADREIQRCIMMCLFWEVGWQRNKRTKKKIYGYKLNLISQDIKLAFISFSLRL